MPSQFSGRFHGIALTSLSLVVAQPATRAASIRRSNNNAQLAFMAVFRLMDGYVADARIAAAKFGQHLGDGGVFVNRDDLSLADERLVAVHEEL